MSSKFILRNLSLALVLFIALVFVGASPALAAGTQSGGRFCAGENLTISAGTSIDSLLAFGCNVTIEEEATVRGDVADFGGNVAISGTVNGNIATFGGNISLASTAVVSGNIASMGGNVQRAPGATVNGNINQNPSGNVTPPIITPFAPYTLGRSFNYGFDFLGGIISALAFAALGALVVIFAPNATRRVSEAVQAQPLNTAGVGCLTLILLPILGLLLILTLIGIPVALVLGILSAAAWAFGSIGVGLLAGEKILKAFQARDILPVVAVVVGVVVLIIIGHIPLLGWLISFVVGLIGLGAVVLTRFGTRTYPPTPTMMLTPAFAAPSAMTTTFTPPMAPTPTAQAPAQEPQAPAPEPEPPAPSEPKAETPSDVMDTPKAEMSPDITDTPNPEMPSDVTDAPKAETPPEMTDTPKPDA